MSAAKKRFNIAGGSNLPNADEAPAATDVKTSGRRDVGTSAGAGAQRRSAFTWRLTPEVARDLDMLVLDVRSELGVAKLDRATLLEALVSVARESQPIRGAVLARLQDAQTS